tara:strand:+ start:44686 stop:45345 length:660 start_codon:yes stop_codon:yes gene_type:complete
MKPTSLLKKTLLLQAGLAFIPASVFGSFYLGGAALYVPEQSSPIDFPISSIDSGDFESGIAYSLRGGYRFQDKLSLELEGHWYSTEANLQGSAPNFGALTGKETITTKLLYVNLLYDLASLFDETNWVIELGGGIGYANLENEIKLNAAAGSQSGSDSDGAFSWQVITNIGYKFTEKFTAGITMHAFSFEGYDWNIQGFDLSSDDFVASSFGAYAAFSF